MATRRFEVTVVTDGSGAATAYTPYLSGAINQISYVKTDYTDGVDFNLTVESTAQPVWVQSDVNAAATVAPRQGTHTTAGVALLYAAGGVAVGAPISVGRDRIKIVLAQGGATKTGKFVITIVDN